MPNPGEIRDREGRTFAEYVSDQVMAAFAARGWSTRRAAKECGINREVLRSRLNGETTLNITEMGQVAVALGVDPVTFVQGFEPV